MFSTSLQIEAINAAVAFHPNRRTPREKVIEKLATAVPGATDEERELAFSLADALYQDVVTYIKEHYEEVSKRPCITGKSTADMDDLIPHFRSLHPNLNEAAHRRALQWGYFWQVLK